MKIFWLLITFVLFCFIAPPGLMGLKVGVALFFLLIEKSTFIFGRKEVKESNSVLKFPK